jgi:hypothetical protein
MHDPRDQHLALTKRILQGYCYPRSSAPTIRRRLLDHLHGYRLCRMPRYSSLHLQLPHLPRRQLGILVLQMPTHVYRPSAKVEYRVIANTVNESTWLPQLLEELYRPLPRATVVFCDNFSAMHVHVYEASSALAYHACQDRSSLCS